MALTRAPRFLRRLVARTRSREAAARSAGVTIGSGCQILSVVATTEPWLVSIGDRVTISSNVRIVTHDGSGWLVDDERGRRFRYAPVSIGSDVFVGAGSIIMPGVRIGDRCVVGAGSVVTRSIPDGTVAAGNPARAVDTYDRLVARMKEWPAASDMVGDTRRRRVDSIAERSYRPEMELPLR
ncbi:acyltransferase [Rhodococcoides kroppenstedtii]|uniref:acyltransferase n=1 Tax=Rhodococcoides kroppenstedtii TaxID=293050 RepID=UPI0025485918|nr:acyltransferase [Rhodococcus kroppenstedtii]